MLLEETVLFEETVLIGGSFLQSFLSLFNFILVSFLSNTLFVQQSFMNNVLSSSIDSSVRCFSESA